MKAEKQGRPSREHEHEHEQVYHAASCCQAASLSLTARRLHGLVKACSIEGKKIGGFASQNTEPLSSFDGVKRLSRLKDSRNIGLVCAQHGEDDPHPHVRQGTDCDTMTFPASRTFALIVGSRPRLAQRTLPSKLMQGIAQGLDTPLASMRLRVVSALKQDRRSASQSLQTGSTFIPRRIVSDFSEQAGRKAFARSGQAQKDLVVFMTQKKLLDLLVIFSELLNQGQELDDQGKRQTRCTFEW